MNSMDNMEWINKIVHGLTTIKELGKANRHLAYQLKKERKINIDLQKELETTKRDLEYKNALSHRYISQVDIIESLNNQIKIMYAEKNALLRKLNIKPKE